MAGCTAGPAGRHHLLHLHPDGRRIRRPLLLLVLRTHPGRALQARHHRPGAHHLGDDQRDPVRLPQWLRHRGDAGVWVGQSMPFLLPLPSGHFPTSLPRGNLRSFPLPSAISLTRCLKAICAQSLIPPPVHILASLPRGNPPPPSCVPPSGHIHGCSGCSCQRRHGTTVLCLRLLPDNGQCAQQRSQRIRCASLFLCA